MQCTVEQFYKKFILFICFFECQAPMFIGFKNIKDPKTIYDPTVISNRQMLDWGWEAMDNGVVSGRIIEGSASNGLKFRGYIGDDGSVTNFFPIFE